MARRNSPKVTRKVAPVKPPAVITYHGIVKKTQHFYTLTMSGMYDRKAMTVYFRELLQFLKSIEFLFKNLSVCTEISVFFPVNKSFQDVIYFRME